MRVKKILRNAVLFGAACVAARDAGAAKGEPQCEFPPCRPFSVGPLRWTQRPWRSSSLAAIQAFVRRSTTPWWCRMVATTRWCPTSPSSPDPMPACSPAIRAPRWPTSRSSRLTTIPRERTARGGSHRERWRLGPLRHRPVRLRSGRPSPRRGQHALRRAPDPRPELPASPLVDPAIDERGDAIVMAAPFGPAVGRAAALGVWYDGSTWWAYNEDGTKLPAGERVLYFDAAGKGGGPRTTRQRLRRDRHRPRRSAPERKASRGGDRPARVRAGQERVAARHFLRPGPGAMDRLQCRRIPARAGRDGPLHRRSLSQGDRGQVASTMGGTMLYALVATFDPPDSTVTRAPRARHFPPITGGAGGGLPPPRDRRLSLRDALREPPGPGRGPDERGVPRAAPQPRPRGPGPTAELALPRGEEPGDRLLAAREGGRRYAERPELQVEAAPPEPAPQVPPPLLESRALKPIHRLCLTLRYVQGMSRAEVAARLGLSETQVRATSNTRGAPPPGARRTNGMKQPPPGRFDDHDSDDDALLDLLGRHGRALGPPAAAAPASPSWGRKRPASSPRTRRAPLARTSTTARPAARSRPPRATGRSSARGRRARAHRPSGGRRAPSVVSHAVAPAARGRPGPGRADALPAAPTSAAAAAGAPAGAEPVRPGVRAAAREAGPAHGAGRRGPRRRRVRVGAERGACFLEAGDFAVAAERLEALARRHPIGPPAAVPRRRGPARGRPGEAARALEEAEPLARTFWGPSVRWYLAVARSGAAGTRSAVAGPLRGGREYRALPVPRSMRSPAARRGPDERARRAVVAAPGRGAGPPPRAPPLPAGPSRARSCCTRRTLPSARACFQKALAHALRSADGPPKPRAAAAWGGRYRQGYLKEAEVELEAARVLFEVQGDALRCRAHAQPPGLGRVPGRRSSAARELYGAAPGVRGDRQRGRCRPRPAVQNLLFFDNDEDSSSA